MKRLYFALRIAAFLAIIALCLTGETKKFAYSPHDKAFYADKALVDFVRPGLVITINSAIDLQRRRNQRDVYPD